RLAGRKLLLLGGGGGSRAGGHGLKVGGIENLLHRRVFGHQIGILRHHYVTEHGVGGGEEVGRAGREPENLQIVGQVVDGGAAQVHPNAHLVLFVGADEILLPVGGVGVLFLVHGGTDPGGIVQRAGHVLHLIAAIEYGFQHALHGGAVVAHPLIDADDDVGHLRGVFLGGNDGNQAAAFLGDVDIAGRPGDDAVDADVFGLAGSLAVVDHGTIFAVAGDVLFGGIQVIRRVDPVHAVGVPGLLVGVAAQAVVAEPFLGDVPIAVTEHAGHQAAAGSGGVALPIGRAEQFVLAAGEAGRTDHTGDVGRTEAAQGVVQALQEGGGPVTHDGDKVRALGGVGDAILQFGGEGNQGFLHLAGIVLAEEAEVDTRVAQQAVGGGLGSPVGEHPTHLRVPRPDEHADFRLVATARRVAGPGHGGNVRRHRRIERRQIHAFGHGGFLHLGAGGNLVQDAVLHQAIAHQAHADQSDDEPAAFFYS